MTAPSRFRPAIAPALAAALLFSACGGTDDTATAPGSGQTPDAQMTDGEMTDGEMTDGEMTDGEITDGEMAMGTSPVLDISATRADGTTFTIGEFADKTVFVETFATWCSTCRKQLVDTDAAASQVGDDVVFLVLSIEVGLDPERLAGYAETHGFLNVQFGVLDENGLAVLNEQFGRSVLNAPSTPKFILKDSGNSLSELTTGLESVDQILAQVA